MSSLLDYGHWNYCSLENINEYEGFIYIITNKLNHRKYIGKKSFWSHTTKKIKGRTNKKHTIKESDWKSYTGSCKELNAAIDLIGKCYFSFEILKLCKTKAELTYEEIYIQMLRDVLRKKLDDGTKEFYNQVVGRNIRI